jgi:hypothetical protein
VRPQFDVGLRFPTCALSRGALRCKRAPSDGYFEPPPEFVIPGEEGRLAAGLRGVLLANTTRPVEILAQSALAFLRGEDAFGRALDDLADRRNCLRELPLTAAARL